MARTSADVEEVVRRPLDLDGRDRSVEIDGEVLVVAELGHLTSSLSDSARVYLGPRNPADILGRPETPSQALGGVAQLVEQAAHIRCVRGSSPFTATMRLLDSLATFLDEEALVRRGDGIVVAFSGGADSTALLYGLTRIAPALGLELRAAHLDHALDPGSAERAGRRRGCRRAARGRVPRRTTRRRRRDDAAAPGSKPKHAAPATTFSRTSAPRSASASSPPLTIATIRPRPSCCAPVTARGRSGSGASSAAAAPSCGRCSSSIAASCARRWSPPASAGSRTPPIGTSRARATGSAACSRRQTRDPRRHGSRPSRTRARGARAGRRSRAGPGARRAPGIRRSLGVVVRHAEASLDTRIDGARDPPPTGGPSLPGEPSSRRRDREADASGEVFPIATAVRGFGWEVRGSRLHLARQGSAPNPTQFFSRILWYCPGSWRSRNFHSVSACFLLRKYLGILRSPLAGPPSLFLTSSGAA